MQYIHQAENWPHFKWNHDQLVSLLAAAHLQQGRLLGQMETLGLRLMNEAALQTLTLDVVKNSEIENEILDANQVRSSIARRLGIDIAGQVPADRNVDGVVEMMLDATQRYDAPLTKQRLFEWHSLLFPDASSGMRKIRVGDWRDDGRGSMQVVSGPYGRERVHFEAPSAQLLEQEMEVFLNWFNATQLVDPLIKAALAHLWFVTIHPFDDGNGRIARTITDMQLARADDCKRRFYSMSTQIQKERNAYYDILESTQKDGLDVTSWLEWFLNCFLRSLQTADRTLTGILKRANFWKMHSEINFNERQRLMLGKLLEEFVGKLTTSKWAKMTKCSQDTALRDIQELIGHGILEKEPSGGRSTSYIMCDS